MAAACMHDDQFIIPLNSLLYKSYWGNQAEELITFSGPMFNECKLVVQF